MLYVQNVTTRKLIMRRDRQEVQIKQQPYFTHVLSASTNGMKIERKRNVYVARTKNRLSVNKREVKYLTFFI